MTQEPHPTVLDGPVCRGNDAAVHAGSTVLPRHRENLALEALHDGERHLILAGLARRLPLLPGCSKAHYLGPNPAAWWRLQRCVQRESSKRSTLRRMRVTYGAMPVGYCAPQVTLSRVR